MKISRSKQRTKDFVLKINPETLEQLPDDASGEKVEELTITMKYLNGGEIDSLQDRRLKTRVSRGGGTTVESDFKYSDFAAQKRCLGVKDWNLIEEETGSKLPITPESMRALPGWLCQWIIDTIDDMNQLGEEEEGE